MKKKYKKLLDVKHIDWEPIINDGRESTMYVYESQEEYNESDIPFQLVYFPDRIHNSNVYIRYPENPFFIEMPNIGMSSGGGCGTYGTGEDPYTGCDITVVMKGEDALVKSVMHTCFLKNTHDVNRAYHDYYLELPPIYRSEYVLDISKLNLYGKQYLLIAQPCYNYTYDKLKAYFVNENGSHMELKIDGIGRARDGGTTKMELVLDFNPDTYEKDEIKFTLFIPTPWKEERICTLNNEVVTLIENVKQENRHVNELGDKLCKAVNLLTSEDIKYSI